jgi:hypothetical protein
MVPTTTGALGFPKGVSISRDSTSFNDEMAYKPEPPITPKTGEFAIIPPIDLFVDLIES